MHRSRRLESPRVEVEVKWKWKKNQKTREGQANVGILKVEVGEGMMEDGSCKL